MKETDEINIDTFWFRRRRFLEILYDILFGMAPVTGMGLAVTSGRYPCTTFLPSSSVGVSASEAAPS